MICMARIGRPPGPRALVKTRQVNIRLTASEFREMSRQARSAGLPLGTFIMQPHRSSPKRLKRG